MEKKEMKEAIKSVYGQLWDLLSLYVETDRYNKVPAGEPEEDISRILGVNMTRLVPSLRDPHIFLPAY